MNSFDIVGRVAVVTGGYGVIGSELARGLAAAGARVGVLGRRADAARREVDAIRTAGGEAIALIADALDRDALAAACEKTLTEWGRVDVLVNAAGGNVARARSDATSVFDIPDDAFDEVLRLNLHGSVVPSMVFGEHMATAFASTRSRRDFSSRRRTARSSSMTTARIRSARIESSRPRRWADLGGRKNCAARFSGLRATRRHS